jgi:hypothetical protein
VPPWTGKTDCQRRAALCIFYLQFMSAWSMHFDNGLRRLARHRPQEAIHLFEAALQECPASKASELYRICFFLGVALKRLGHSQTAIKSWLSCRRLKKRGHAGKLLARLTNPYGMARQECESMDDWEAFASLQMSRYLLSKQSRAFSTRAEYDMIMDLIMDSWKSLAESGGLYGKNCAEKHAVFASTRIIFPSLVVASPAQTSPVISVNFRSQKRLGLNDRCFCGSGLPFSMCCGRMPGSEELLGGIF